MKYFRIIILLLTLVIFRVAHAEVRYDTSFLYDPEATLQVTDLPARAMERFDNDLQMGFRSGAVWIRINIEGQLPASAVEGDGLYPVLRLGPFLLDRIELFEWSEGSWQKQIAGDMRPQHADHSCPDDRYCFNLKTPITTQNTLYVRVRTHGLMSVHTHVVTLKNLPATVTSRILMINAPLWLASCLLMLGAVLLLHGDSRLIPVYCAFQVTVILFLLANTGLLYGWLGDLSPRAMNVIVDLVTALRLLTTVTLGWVLISRYQPSANYVRCIQLMLLLGILSVLLIVAGLATLGLKLIFVLYVLNSFLQLYGALSCKNLSVHRKRIWYTAHTLYVVMVLLGILNMFGGMDLTRQLSLIRSVPEWRLNGIGIWLAYFILVLYEQFSRQGEKNAELHQLRHHAVQLRATEHQLADRHALLNILTHELKNPLGTVTFALANLKNQLQLKNESMRGYNNINASIQRMDTLIANVARRNQMDAPHTGQPTELINAQRFFEKITSDFEKPERFALHIQPQAYFTADPFLLKVAFENLLRNAYQYGIADEKITVDVQMGLHGPEVEISNPVAADKMPDPQQLFDRYYRHENVRDRPGMGIGLSLVQGSAEKMNASIAYRQRGENAVFTLKFKHAH